LLRLINGRNGVLRRLDDISAEIGGWIRTIGGAKKVGQALAGLGILGLLAITSTDRLYAGWTAANQARERGVVNARSHIERLMEDLPRHCRLVSVLDGQPHRQPPWVHRCVI